MEMDPVQMIRGGDGVVTWAIFATGLQFTDPLANLRLLAGFLLSRTEALMITQVTHIR